MGGLADHSVLAIGSKSTELRFFPPGALAAFPPSLSRRHRHLARAAARTLAPPKKFYVMVPIGPSYTLHSARYLMASVVADELIAPLGIVGCWQLLRSGRATLLLPAASVPLTAIIFFPQERFRIPILDPRLIIGASILLAGVPTRR